jgi:hypothetical protein
VWQPSARGCGVALARQLVLGMTDLANYFAQRNYGFLITRILLCADQVQHVLHQPTPVLTRSQAHVEPDQALQLPEVWPRPSH